nr:EOG090X03TX [Lepidurus arcticus]
MDSSGNFDWSLELELALAEEREADDIRALCMGHVIPDQFRPQVWLKYFGIVSSLAKSPLSLFNQIFDLPQQEILREDCKRLVGNLNNNEEEKLAILSDLESIFTVYCKSHSFTYDRTEQWPKLLTPLISLKLSADELYLCFQTIRQRYIPKSGLVGCAPCHLLRLLLLYHDPELCTVLDTHKVIPEHYALDWFRTLLSCSVPYNGLLALWDSYFTHDDPFLIFFLALVLIVNAKEDLFSLRSQGRRAMLDFLISLPANLEPDDVADLMSVAVFYAVKTPTSFQTQYGDLLFGNFTDPELHHSLSLCLSQSLCLPIGVQELLAASGQSSSSSSKDASGPKFFLVDCRPPEQYNAGHLPTAFHLDCSLVPVSGLLSAQRGALAARSAAGGEHLCFTGSGLSEHVEEDGLLHMAVSSFLQKHVPYVSELQDGFGAVHLAWENEQRNPLSTWSLADHRPEFCLLCVSKQLQIGSKPNGALCDSNPKSINSDKSKSPDFFDKLRGKLMDYIVNPGTANASTPSTAAACATAAKPTIEKKGKGKEVQERHVSSRDRTKRRYRNMAPVFSIDDEQDEETHLYALRELPESSSTNKGTARITVRRGLTSIVKITSKKRHPELISFKYGTSEGEEVTITDMDSSSPTTTHPRSLRLLLRAEDNIGMSMSNSSSSSTFFGRLNVNCLEAELGDLETLSAFKLEVGMPDPTDPLAIGNGTICDKSYAEAMESLSSASTSNGDSDFDRYAGIISIRLIIV